MPWLIAMVVLSQRWKSMILVFSSLNESMILRPQYQSKEMRGKAASENEKTSDNNRGEQWGLQGFRF